MNEIDKQLKLEEKITKVEKELADMYEELWDLEDKSGIKRIPFIEKKNKKNFPFRHKGETFWYSRSCAVAGFIFQRTDDGEILVLVNQRGPGAPDFQMHWNAPCGYLDWDEDGQMAITRETAEETGLKTFVNRWIQMYTQTDPRASDNQNITIRYCYVMNNKEDDFILYSKQTGGEVDEVADIKWLNVKDLDKYEWAFGHQELIEKYAIELTERGLL